MRPSGRCSSSRWPRRSGRRRSFEAVAAFVRGLADQQPLLLVVDDLHLAGASTLELLHFLRRRLHGDRVLVLAGVRAEEGAEALAALAEAGPVLELGPLPAAAVAELARRFGVADLAGPVLERARATPCSRWRACGRRPRAAATGPRSRRRSGTRCRPGRGRRRPGPLVREVLYATSPRPTRVTRHRRLVGVLADRPEAAAGHAAAGDWPAAARAWMAAAANAAGSYANRDAERLLGQAVAAAAQAGDPSLEAGARLDRGRVLVALGDYPAAFADQERALELAVEHGLDRLEAAAPEQLGWTAYYDRDHQAASALSPQARELARAYGSTKYQALALARLGRRPEAAGLVAATGSDYLLAQVAPPPQARAAVDRIAAGLPPELRPGFLERGRLAVAIGP